MATVYKRKGSKSKYYHCDYIDRNGERVRKSTKIVDKKAAQDLANHWEAQERLLRYGVRDETIESQKEAAGQSITSALAEWSRAATVEGKSAVHISKTDQRVTSIASHNKWTTLAEISTDGVVRYLDSRKKEGASPNTVKHYLVAMKLFCRWCVDHQKLTKDPTDRIGRPSTVEDRRIVRRMLLVDEWKWIAKYLANGPSRNAQEARERYLMYWTALETGLRSSELRSLTKRSIVLASDEPHIIVKGASTKNSKDAKQYISDELKAALVKFVKTRTSSEKVFQPKSEYDMAAVLREDLEGARLLWLESKPKEPSEDFLSSSNGDGESIDFHALRHTCGAWLVINGVTLPEVQNILRHSSIVLTIDTYGHLAPGALSSRRNVISDLIKK